MPSQDPVLPSVSDLIERALSGVPAPLRPQVSEAVRTYKEMLMEARAPKLMFLGRRGAGKSSLVNALCGEPVATIGSVLSETGRPTWYTARTAKGELRLLDTRGIGDRTRPEASNFQNALDEIRAALEEDWPDAILFLCKAKDVDSHIGEDLANIREVRRFLLERHRYDAPVVALVTQIDELDPKRVEPPYDNPVKQENIRTAVTALEEALAEQGIGLARVVPVSAYAEFDAEGKRTYDNYWNIDVLVEYLVEVLPRSAQVQMARLSRVRAVQTKTARKMTAAAAALTAGIAATPIPVADILPITATQVGLITGIAWLSGRELSKDAAKEFLVALGANLGAAFALRELARAAGKIAFPVGGEIISAGVAAAGTWGIGEAAIAYFIENRSIDEAKERFRRRKEQKEDS
ncbi:MAG TPA: GTPase [Thermoanaerobaculia bacterium]|nr:GTPase [Thermoanaerobaculia bacterium]